MSASPSAATTAADLRLVPPAVAAWGAALVVTLAPGVLRPAATGAGWLLAAAAAAVLFAAAGRV
ncbi:hypothetical protein, partial [Cellulomonas iranensis]|uniref:hypothetical protein n=1 Tax=Cellulomonas iranensis TaxID=76862 RepID=UPI001969C204